MTKEKFKQVYVLQIINMDNFIMIYVDKNGKKRRLHEALFSDTPCSP